MADIKLIPIAEFRKLGYLQEVNRRFLHPLGLAIEVEVEEDGTERLGGVWDYRDDPEGMLFAPDDIDAEKVAYVAHAWEAREPIREGILGYMVQPADPPEGGA